MALSEPDFVRIFEAHGDAVFRYLLRRFDRATAEDLLSETFLVLWRRQQQPRDPLPWLLGAAKKMSANEHRRQRRRPTTELPGDAIASIEVCQVADVRLERLGSAINRLSPGDREVLLLVLWDELEPEQAARVLGIRPATFRARSARARRRLIALLDEHNPSLPAVGRYDQISG